MLNPLILALILARPPAHRDRTRPWDRVRTLFVAGDPFPFVYTIQIPTVTVTVAVTATPTVTATVAVAVAVAVAMTATATMAVAVAVLTVTVSLTLAGIDAQLMLQRIIFFMKMKTKHPICVKS